jgi:hypothetical protein
MDIVCGVPEGTFISKSVANYICRATSDFASTIIFNQSVANSDA